jgi:transketolase
MSLSEHERASIVKPGMPCISVEAGSTFGWSAIATHSLGIDRFGASAPGAVVMSNLGINVENLVALVRRAVGA